MRKIKTVGVIGSNRDEWVEYAIPLGQALGQRNVNLLTGGGAGVMTSVTKSFTEVAERKGMAIACIPTKKDENGIYQPKIGYPNPFVEFVIVSPLDTFNPKKPERINRNYLNILSSDVVIALPGRTGTRNEIELCRQFNKPVILHGPEDQWHDLPDDLRREENLERTLLWLDLHL